mmetsp:Transcript_6085/g.18270  ORF Transcript_6085/g.18270 Transcript_6085/m.18270 type:complete len:293 (-) Transcript_6085:881-1759(-)
MRRMRQTFARPTHSSLPPPPRLSAALPTSGSWGSQRRRRHGGRPRSWCGQARRRRRSPSSRQTCSTRRSRPSGTPSRTRLVASYATHSGPPLAAGPPAGRDSPGRRRGGYAWRWRRQRRGRRASPRSPRASPSRWRRRRTLCRAVLQWSCWEHSQTRWWRRRRRLAPPRRAGAGCGLSPLLCCARCRPSPHSLPACASGACARFRLGWRSTLARPSPRSTPAKAPCSPPPSMPSPPSTTSRSISPLPTRSASFSRAQTARCLPARRGAPATRRRRSRHSSASSRVRCGWRSS